MAKSPRARSPDLARLEVENDSLRLENRALRRFVGSMQSILRAAESAGAAADIREVLREVLTHAMRSIDARDGSLLALDEASGELVFVVTEGDAPVERLAWRRLPAGQGIAGWVAAQGRAATVNNPREDDRFYPVIDAELHFRTASILAAPIIGGGGVLGVIELLNKRDGHLFSATDQLLLTLISRFAGELLHTLVSPQVPDAPTGAAASHDEARPAVVALGDPAGARRADERKRNEASRQPRRKPAAGR